MIFVRQLIAQARPHDVAIALSTSGGSRNVVAALEEARKRGMLTSRCSGTTAARSSARDSPTLRSSCTPITFRASKRCKGRFTTSFARHLDRSRACRLSSTDARVRTPPNCARELEWDGATSSSSTTSKRCGGAARLLALSGAVSVPVLVEDGRVIGGLARPRLLRRGRAAREGTPARAVEARRLHSGVVQGVGFRPFVYRLARATRARLGAQRRERRRIHAEGDAEALRASCALKLLGAAGGAIASIESHAVGVGGLTAFEIRESEKTSADRAHFAGPAGLRRLPARTVRSRATAASAIPTSTARTAGRATASCSRCRTTVRTRPCATGRCATPARANTAIRDRRFHAQPVACPQCGPAYVLQRARRASAGSEAIAARPRCLPPGRSSPSKVWAAIIWPATRDGRAVGSLRERKYRKERPFALMARDLEAARELVELSPEPRAAASVTRPIVLGAGANRSSRRRAGQRELGVMLPYTPLHDCCSRRARRTRW